MNIRKLKTFVLLIEHKSFSIVAAHLNCSQPAVSRQIKSLENDLNTALLDRNSAHVRPTPAGQFVYGKAKAIIEQWESLQTELQGYHDTLTGNLVIGTSTIPGTYLIPQWVRRFQLQYPKVAVSVEISASEKVLEKLKTEHIDIGIVGSKPQTNDMQFVPVATDSLVFITPADHPLNTLSNDAWSSLTKYDFVLREEGSGTRKMMEDFLSGHGIRLSDLRIVLQVGSTEALISAVEAGIGVSCVSDLAAVPAMKAGRIKIIDGLSSIKRTFYLTMLQKKRNYPIIKAFGTFVQDLDGADDIKSKK